MPLIVAIPVCHKDGELVTRNLDRILKMDGQVNHRAIVFYDDVFGDYSGQKIVEKARLCFDEVEHHVYGAHNGPTAWPHPQNRAWQTAARYIEALNLPNGQGWLWWEGDATPTKAGWLDKLAEAYGRPGRAVFMGHIVEGKGHMNGVAVYPCNISNYCTKPLLVKASPFDMALSQEVDKSAIKPVNHLIAHKLKRFGGDEPTEIDLSKCPSTVVLYHGCTQGIKQIEGSIEAFPEEKPTLMQVLMAWRASKGKFSTKTITTPSYSFSITTPRPTIWHVTERHKTDNADAERRTLQAEASWLNLYKSGEMKPCHLWRYPRSSKQMDDSRWLPFLKDVFSEGLTQCRKDTDIVLWTNDDTILHAQSIEAVLKLMATTDAINSFRVNFEKGNVPVLTTDTKDICATGRFDLGRDVFAFRASWLKTHWHEIPDFLLGEMEFDLVMAVLMRKLAGLATTKANINEVIPKVEIPRGYVLHETHVRSWVSEEFKKSPSKAWNQKLCLEWYSDNGFHCLISKPTVTQ